jgi:hypothetical protein
MITVKVCSCIDKKIGRACFYITLNYFFVKGVNTTKVYKKARAEWLTLIGLLKWVIWEELKAEQQFYEKKYAIEKFVKDSFTLLQLKLSQIKI